MKQVILAAILLSPLPAMAQAVSPAPIGPSPADEAMQQRIIQLTGDALNWQVQAITAQRQVADLTKQLADAKATDKPAP